MPILVVLLLILGAYVLGENNLQQKLLPQATPSPSKEVSQEPSSTPKVENTPTPTPQPPPSERAVRAATFFLAVIPEKNRKELIRVAEDAKKDVITLTARALDRNSELLVKIESVEQLIKDKKEAAKSALLLELVLSNLYRPQPPSFPTPTPYPTSQPLFPETIHCITQPGFFSTTTDCY